MEYYRDYYTRNVASFKSKLELSEKLLKLLSEHQFFGKILQTNKDISDDWMKCLILLAFTETRYKCNELIKILNHSDQKDLATALKVYNTSPGRKIYSDDIYIEVAETVDPKTHLSGIYEMSQNLRGMALIVNNVSDIVYNESLRFECVFKQLMFNVKLKYRLTSAELITELTDLRDNINLDYRKTEFIPQCLIVMIISHGEDEKIKASDDVLVSTDIINDIFASGNFFMKRPFPKLLFYTCCQIIREEHRNPMEKICALECDFDNNSHTLQCHSSAEGYRTFTDGNGYTYFGKTFSESIAQYACRESLTSIMNRTNEELCKLEGMIFPIRDEDGHIELVTVQRGHVAPVAKMIAPTRNLHFNPHWVEQKLKY